VFACYRASLSSSPWASQAKHSLWAYHQLSCMACHWPKAQPKCPHTEASPAYWPTYLSAVKSEAFRTAQLQGPSALSLPQQSVVAASTAQATSFSLFELVAAIPARCPIRPRRPVPTLRVLGTRGPALFAFGDRSPIGLGVSLAPPAKA
jgi:hypothetical protein